MARIPTDLQILNEIFNRYYEAFDAYDEDESIRSSKVHVPIDIYEIGKRFGVDEDIIFGRLYYDMDQRYGYTQRDDVRVPFFSMRSGGDRHCVNFPYMASVLANLRDQHNKYRLATGMSILSLVMASVSFGVSILT